MGFPLGAGARDIEANSQFSTVSQRIDISPVAAVKTPQSRLGASSAHITELCNMMQTYERHKQWAVEQRGLTIRAPTPLSQSDSTRSQWATTLQPTNTTFSSAYPRQHTVHPTIQSCPNDRDYSGGEGSVAARDHETREEDQCPMSEDDISGDAAVQASDHSSSELCKPRPPILPSLASILTPAPTSLAQYKLSSMQRGAPGVVQQKQEVLLNLFAELSQERLDSLVGLVRLVASVPDGVEHLRSLPS